MNIWLVYCVFSLVAPTYELNLSIKRLQTTHHTLPLKKIRTTGGQTVRWFLGNTETSKSKVLQMSLILSMTLRMSEVQKSGFHSHRIPGYNESVRNPTLVQFILDRRHMPFPPWLLFKLLTELPGRMMA